MDLEYDLIMYVGLLAKFWFKSLMKFVFLSMIFIAIIVTTGFAFAEENKDLTTYIENARELLKQASSEYQAGNYERADELVKEAYLDNFEYVEVPLEKNGAGELKEDIEESMRLDLRDMIKNRASQDDIDAKILEIDDKLSDAYAKVPEFPFGVMLSLVSMIGIIVAVTRIRGYKLTR